MSWREQEARRLHQVVSRPRAHQVDALYALVTQPSRPPVVRDGHKVGRNEPCPCGSGKKHKKCCGGAT